MMRTVPVLALVTLVATVAVAGAAGLQISGGPGQVVSSAVIAPVPPVPLQLDVGDGPTVAMSWSDPAGAASFRVLRSDGGSFFLVASPGAPTYEDHDVVVGTTYSYQVYTVASDGAVSATAAEGSVEITEPPD